MRVLLWTTTLQADILALALALRADPECELCIVSDAPAVFAGQPIAKYWPSDVTVLDRDARSTAQRVRDFRADVAVFDNHFPPFKVAPRLCSLWHGLGWKARPTSDLEQYYRHVRELTGLDPRAPHPRFFAQCYGEPDRAWRVEQWGLDPASCHVVGSCFDDLLYAPPYTREQLAPHYPFALGHKPTLLLNLTWHYGRIFPGSWQPRLFRPSPFAADLAFLEQVFGVASDLGQNVLFCLHDRRRYEKSYLDAIHRLAARHGNVYLKHKDEHPDNLADLVVADAMMSNLSSFITFFYRTGRPSIHLCPPATDKQVRFSRLSFLGPRARQADDGVPWMNAPSDNGGLTATDATETRAAMARALSEPDCCRERSQAWLAAHVHRPQGGTAQAFIKQLKEWVASS